MTTLIAFDQNEEAASVGFPIFLTIKVSTFIQIK
jgi:hypothetical protein